MTEPRTDTKTLAHAMWILACDIQSDDGVANAAIQEAAERLLEQDVKIETLMEYLKLWQAKALKFVNVPEGWQLVPIEPTEAMVDAAALSMLAQESIQDTYKAMLWLAPKPEEQK